MRNYDIQYNGVTGASHGLILYDYPEFGGAEKSYETYPVAGRLGELVGVDDYKSNLTITCVFSVISKALMDSIRGIKDWLSGNGELVLSDSPDIYYKVWKIDYDGIERELRHYGRFTAIFTCTPYEYRLDGKNAVDAPDFNPYSLSRPSYLITGNGTCTLTVNGKNMTATVNGDLEINTELMLSTRQDGTLQNTAVTGNYDDLYLQHGENQISITAGYGLQVMPNWGYDV